MPFCKSAPKAVGGYTSNMERFIDNCTGAPCEHPGLRPEPFSLLPIPIGYDPWKAIRNLAASLGVSTRLRTAALSQSTTL